MWGSSRLLAGIAEDGGAWSTELAVSMWTPNQLQLGKEIFAYSASHAGRPCLLHGQRATQSHVLLS